ncbi:MAG: hypothetical protein AAFN40_27975 [Cyanobacteria bacterium J06560_6]
MKTIIILRLILFSIFVDPIPVMVMVAEQALPTFKAEMEAIAALPTVQTTRQPGTLGMAEEYGETVAAAMLPFLQATND